MTKPDDFDDIERLWRAEWDAVVSNVIAAADFGGVHQAAAEAAMMDPTFDLAAEADQRTKAVLIGRYRSRGLTRRDALTRWDQYVNFRQRLVRSKRFKRSPIAGQPNPAGAPHAVPPPPPLSRSARRALARLREPVGAGGDVDDRS